MLVIFRISFEGLIRVLIASDPGLYILFTFTVSKWYLKGLITGHGVQCLDAKHQYGKTTLLQIDFPTIWDQRTHSVSVDYALLLMYNIWVSGSVIFTIVTHEQTQ